MMASFATPDLCTPYHAAGARTVLTETGAQKEMVV
jgi:hypothetical protein